MANDYDVLIIGGGLAGLTAGMYAARYGLNTGLIEQMMGGPGGWARVKCRIIFSLRGTGFSS